MTTSILISSVVIYSCATIINAAEWNFPMDSIKIKRHHTRFCVYIKGMQARCFDNKGTANETNPDLDVVKKLFHLKHQYETQNNLVNEEQPVPEEQPLPKERPLSNEEQEDAFPTNPRPLDGDKSPAQLEDDNIKPQMLAGIDTSKLNEEMSSRELLEMERDFYKNLYCTFWTDSLPLKPEQNHYESYETIENIEKATVPAIDEMAPIFYDDYDEL